MADKDSKGAWIDPSGTPIPLKYVKPVNRKRDQMVERIHKEAKKLEAALQKFRDNTDREVTAYLEWASSNAGVELNKGGNYTFTNFSGNRRVEIGIGKTLEFDEQINAAKMWIDVCLTKWSEDVDERVKILIANAFKVGTKGQLSTADLLNLFNVNIKDPEWEKAMDLLRASITIAVRKAYLKVQTRESKETWITINMNLARTKSQRLV